MNLTILTRQYDINIFNFVLENFYKEHIKVALPTGNTPLDLYKNIVGQKDINWRKVNIFMLDVLYPQNPTDQNSYYSYIKKKLLNHINLPMENFHILNSAAKNPDLECNDYEEQIKNCGGLDLAILGIGQNGHIAFNEPGTDFKSRTHLSELTAETKINNGFSKDSNVQSLTMGISTIFEAKKIILLAKGKEKAKIVRQAIKDPISSACPASFLQNHPDCTFFLDQGAARLLK